MLQILIKFSSYKPIGIKKLNSFPPRNADNMEKPMPASGALVFLSIPPHTAKLKTRVRWYIAEKYRKDRIQWIGWCYFFVTLQPEALCLVACNRR